MSTKSPRSPAELAFEGPWWSRVGARATGLHARVMAADQFESCQRFLYEVYYCEGGWDPATPNASALRANHERRRFEDDLDEEAIWIGVFDGGHDLVAVTRIIDRRLSGRLELERYIDLPERFSGPEVIEANRIAVRRSHRATLAVTLAQLMAVWAAHQRGARYSIGAAQAKVAFGPAAAYGWCSLGTEFRYHPTDPEPVHLIYCDLVEQRRPSSLARLMLRVSRGMVGKAFARTKRRD